MDMTFIDFMSNRLSEARTGHDKSADQILFDVPTDLGVANVSIRTKGEFTVCVAGIAQPIPPDQIGRVAELINRMNMEFGPGSLTADFDAGMIVCRTGVPFGLIRNDDRVASLLLGSTFGGLSNAVRATRELLKVVSVSDALQHWRDLPMPASFTLPDNSQDRPNSTEQR